MALAFFLVFVIALLERRHLVYLGLTYIPFSSAILIISDWIIAALLLAQSRALRTRPLAVLAAGFFFTGVLNILRLLAVPSFVKPDPTNQTPLLFYLVSHAPLPLAAINNAWSDRGINQSTPPATTAHPATRYLAGAIILAGSLMFAATTAKTTLHLTSPVFLTGATVLLLTIAAMVMLGLGLRSELDLWLLLALWGWLLEVVLITLESPGNTIAWYAARALGIVSSLFVLFSLIAESSRLYGQSVQQLEDQDQERERRFLIREAITASIAHELRQPLTAMMLNAQVAQKYPESQNGGLAEILAEIVASGHRASEIIETTRAMFGNRPSQRHAVDLGPFLRNTLDMVCRTAHARAVSVSLVVEGTLKPVSISKVQMQQAMLNLFQNAIEALGRVKGRPRTLQVRCFAGPDQENVIIRIEDNGPGIEPDQRKNIFKPFFTTRKKGTGLGLMIANLVLEAHGGQITVELLSPFGTAFVLRLPYDGGIRIAPYGANISQSQEELPAAS